jgi:hypothetical protein
VHPWLFLLAEAGSDPVNLGILAQYGVLGLVAGGLIIFAKGSHKRETDRSDRLEAEVARLNTVIIDRDNIIMDRVIPALTSTTKAVEEATDVLRGMQHERQFSMARPATEQSRRVGRGGA